MYNYKNYEEGSFDLGMAYAFCEVVGRDVKKLALSNIMSSETFLQLQTDYDYLQQKFQVKGYVEENLISTYLAPDSECKGNGKVIVLFYKHDKEIIAYLELKSRVEALQEKGQYTHPNKKACTIEFCRILSYSQEQIDEIINSIKE